MPEYDFQQAAERLGVSWQTVRRRVQAGELPGRLDEHLRKWMVTLPDDLGGAGEPEAPGARDLCAVLEHIEAMLAVAQGDRDRMRDDLERISREITDERRRLLDLLEIASRANATSLSQIAEQLAEQRDFRSEAARWMAEHGRPAE